MCVKQAGGCDDCDPNRQVSYWNNRAPATGEYEHLRGEAIKIYMEKFQKAMDEHRVNDTSGCPLLDPEIDLDVAHPEADVDASGQGQIRSKSRRSLDPRRRRRRHHRRTHLRTGNGRKEKSLNASQEGEPKRERSDRFVAWKTRMAGVTEFLEKVSEPELEALESNLAKLFKTQGQQFEQRPVRRKTRDSSRNGGEAPAGRGDAEGSHGSQCVRGILPRRTVESGVREERGTGRVKKMSGRRRC